MPGHDDVAADPSVVIRDGQRHVDRRSRQRVADEVRVRPGPADALEVGPCDGESGVEQPADDAVT